MKILFSDKTGTLTKNEMILQQCSINGKKYTIQNFGVQEENSSNVIRLPQYDHHMLKFFETLATCHTVQVHAKSEHDENTKDDGVVERTFEIIESSSSLVDIEEDKRNEETRQNTKQNEVSMPDNLIDNLPISVERKIQKIPLISFDNKIFLNLWFTFFSST